MGKSHPLGTWQPWRPPQVAAFFAPLSAPWWIAGGWAIDLFLGRQTREHEDIDVLILRRDHAAVRSLFATWDMQAALPPPRDETWPFRVWGQGEMLEPAIHDIWCRPSAAQPWAIQLMVADTHDDRWLFRRMPTIERTIATLGSITPAGIPYLAPRDSVALQGQKSPRKGRSRLHSNVACALCGASSVAQGCLAHGVSRASVAQATGGQITSFDAVPSCEKPEKSVMRWYVFSHFLNERCRLEQEPSRFLFHPALQVRGLRCS